MDSPSTSAFSSPASTPTTATSSDAYISDVYSLTDKQLSERLEFREEVRANFHHGKLSVDGVSG
jgi:hypothetical protein